MPKENWKKKFKATKYVLKVAKKNNAEFRRGKGDHLVIVNRDNGEHFTIVDGEKEQSPGIWGNIATTFSGWWYPFIVLCIVLVFILIH